MLETPVLLIAWRRPHTLKAVIDAIRPHAPSLVFVACDGPDPSRPDEASKVAAARRVIENEIDWPCKLERLYSETNQGCRLGVSRAISWFFSHVEEGIILEDDCIPHPDFFPYCTILLQRYRNDARIWCISGSNFQDGQWRGDGSYYFSRYTHCWGWASWRRCWQHYDSSLEGWPKILDLDLLESLFEYQDERHYWRSIWHRLAHEGLPDTWDYQWLFTCMVNGGLTALPNRNLVTNIGFGVDATHTIHGSSSAIATMGIEPIHHPHFLLRDRQADHYSFLNHYNNYSAPQPKSYSESFKRFAKKLLSLRAIL